MPLSLCASLTCQANDYFFKPVLSAKEGYYSNISLLQEKDDPQDNWVSTLSPGVNFGLRHENGELNSNFTWNQLFYSNQSSKLNTSEQLFSVGYQHKNERLQWGARGSYNNQSYLNSEGTVLGPSGGTVLGGANLNQIMAKQLSLAPSVTYSINELSTVSFDYSYYKTDYEKNQNAQFYSDYDYHQVSGTFNYLYTERDKLNVTLSGSRYKSKPQVLDQATFIQLLDQTTYNEVAQLGWQHSFSEQLITYVSAGMNYSQAETTLLNPAFSYCDTSVFSFVISPCFPYRYRFVPASEETTNNNNFGQVYQASIQKSFERGSVSLVGSRNQTPTSQGLQTSTSISTNNAYKISERWNSGLTASYSNNVVTGQQSNLYDRTYFTISPNINWKWTPEINVGLSYSFRYQEYQNQDSSQGNAQGNTVQLQISYQPQTNYNYQVK